MTDQEKVQRLSATVHRLLECLFMGPATPACQEWISRHIDAAYDTLAETGTLEEVGPVAPLKRKVRAL